MGREKRRGRERRKGNGKSKGNRNRTTEEKNARTTKISKFQNPEISQLSSLHTNRVYISMHSLVEGRTSDPAVTGLYQLGT